MIINKANLSNLIYNVIKESIVNETIFEIDQDDPNMQQKVSKIKNDSTIYNDSEDEIKISNESVYSKKDVLEIIDENKKKKSGSNEDYIKAIKKADRELDYELNGPGWKSKTTAHKNKKKYNRKDKSFLNDSINEAILTKRDISNMIMEKKYNAKVYCKSKLLNEILGENEMSDRDYKIDQILQFLNSQDDGSAASKDDFTKYSDTRIDDIYNRIQTAKNIH